MDYQEFWERFQKAEQAADVFNISTIGYQLYPMLRTRLYYQLAQELGIFDNPHPNQEPQSEVQTANLNHLVGKSAPVVIVPFVRLVQGDDVYSAPLREAYGSEARVLGHDEIGQVKNYGKEHFDRFVYDAMLQEKKRDVRDRWAKMAESFSSELGVGLGKFHEFPNWLVRRYIGECLAFKELFSQLGTKKVFIVNAYSHPALVVGAKQAGAKAIEIQHGFVSDYHPAYSYPKVRIQSAPDRILVWGDYWKKAASFPKGLKPVVTGPAQNYLNQRALFTGVEETKSILFSSQGALGSKLIREAIIWAKALPEYQLVYRLHPNEDLADYQGHELPKNLTLSHKKPSFLELLQLNSLLVGGFSTTIYEALGFGMKAIALKLPGHQNLGPAVATGDVLLAELGLQEAQIRGLIAKARKATNPYSYYAKTNDVKRAMRA